MARTTTFFDWRAADNETADQKLIAVAEHLAARRNVSGPSAGRVEIVQFH